MGSYSPNHLTRKSLAVLAGLMLLGLSVFIVPMFLAEQSADENWRGSFYRIRTVFANTESKFDTVAERVYGQYTLTETFVVDAPTNDSLFAPADLFVYNSGQIFIADTNHNRVLSWNNVDDYIDGDPADLVIGQPDFTSSQTANPPTASSLNHPTAVYVDFQGNLYVSDTGNNRILIYTSEVTDKGVLVFKTNQAAALVIGQPDFTSNAAPNPPTATSLNHPMGLVLDFHNNLVVADRNNNRVVIYTPPLQSGMATTRLVGQATDKDGFRGSANTNFAANPPTALSLNHPSGVAIGATAAELYVADTGNNRIVVYNNEAPLNGRADLVIGQPDFNSNTANNGGISSTSFNGPTGLKMDTADRLLVADTDNNRVLVFVNPLLDQTADTVFGQPDFNSNTANNGGVSGSSLSGPTGMATDEFFMDIYIADPGNHRALTYWQPLQNPLPQIQELSPGTVRAGSDGFTLDIWGLGIISGTTVQLNGETRAAGDDYFGLMQLPIKTTDIAATGSLSLTLTNPAPGGGTSEPFTLTVYAPRPGDDMPDSILGQVGFTTDDGFFQETAANNLFKPLGVVIDPTSGRIYVADSGQGRVLSWPNQAAFGAGAAADLIIGQADFKTMRSEFITADTLNFPVGLALDSSGNLYVADPIDNRVLIFKAPLSNGMAATTVIGQLNFESDLTHPSPTANNINNPLGLALDSQDNLYLADAEYNRVLIYLSPLTTDTTADFVLGQNGSFTTRTPNLGGLSAASLSFPSGVALDSQDNLYVADQKNNRVLRFDNPLTQDTIADEVFGATSARQIGSSLNNPSGVAVDKNDNLYVADRLNHQVLFYDSPSSTDTKADRTIDSLTGLVPNGVRTQKLNQPYSMAVDGHGNLFIVDSLHNRVLGYLNPQADQTSDRIYIPLIVRE